MVVPEGEVGVVGGLWCQAVEEVLPAAWLVSVHCRHCLDELHVGAKERSSALARLGQRFEPEKKKWRQLSSAIYLSGFGVLAQVCLQVLGQRGGVVVDVQDPDCH